MNYDKMHERYLNDPLFNKVVQMLYNVMYEGHMTVSELRDAATYAGMKFEAENVKPTIIPRGL